MNTLVLTRAHLYCRWRLWLALLLALTILLLAGQHTAEAAPDNAVTIVNLRPTAVFVAYATRSVGDPGDLTFVPDPYLTINCWRRIDPGEGETFPAGASWFYVKQNGSRISWPDRPEATGVVRNGGICSSNVTVPISSNNAARLQYWETQGFQQATFQELSLGRLYQISGAAYDMHSQRFSFDFGSRDYQFHHQCFRAPGTVVDYSVSAQRRHGPADTWTVRGEELCLSVRTRGHQPYPTAATDRGYFRGSVTVSYTLPRTNSGNGGEGNGGVRSITLRSGFTPDPYRLLVTAGGTRRSSGSCGGYHGSQPAAYLNWSGGGSTLNLYMTSSLDTVLYVVAPNGVVSCDDDWGSTLNPMVTINNPQTGRYTIYAARYSQGTAEAILHVTALSSRNPGNP